MYCFAKALLKKQKIKSIWRENDDRNFRYKKSTSWCYLLKWSGKRGSNSRPRPWQGRALPTELFPHTLLVRCILREFEILSIEDLKKKFKC